MPPSEQTNLAGADAAPVLPVHKEGFSIADYRKIARLGEGTFGDVWKAERGGHEVALKILKASMSSDETQRELKSLETLKRLHHKFLLHTENFWSDGDRLFIEMELADGGTLKERLKAFQSIGKDGIPAEELLKFFTETATALDYLHGHRPVFLHRDIKPANILLVQGYAKLADFGLLRQVTGDNTSTKTQGGTPVYMAPESIKEDKFSVHTDLFSFAVTYVELRQGKLPYFAKTQFQIYKKICEDPPDLSDIFHPEERKVLLKALEKDPDKRFPSCGEFVFELNRLVPWNAAQVLISLPAPPRPEKGAGSSSLPKSVEVKPLLDPPDFGTSRKRPPGTMHDIEIAIPGAAGPNAPTANQDEDGTVASKKGSKSKTGTDPSKKTSAIDLGTKNAPTGAGTGSQPKTGYPSPKKDAKPSAKPSPKVRNRTMARVFLSVVVIGISAGVWFVASLFIKGNGDPPVGNGTNPKPNGDGARPRLSAAAVGAKVDEALDDEKIEVAWAIVEQYKGDLPDRGKELYARIENRRKVIDVLTRADELLNKKDYPTCLMVLAKGDATFERPKDIERKNTIYESARDQVHLRLVGDMQDSLKAGDTPRVRAAHAALTRFRKEHTGRAWRPAFQEMPYPVDLQAEVWKTLLADKVVAADCRSAFDKLRDYANPREPEKFVLDSLYGKNVLALEALVKAHEANAQAWDRAFADVVAAINDSKEPVEFNRNLWLALVQLERNRNLIRFDDLDGLPPAPADEQAKKAGGQLFGQVLERLIRADNFKWLPNEKERGKIVTWCDDRVDAPSAYVRALKAESLVGSGKAPGPAGALGFPVKADWYGTYVHALVRHKNASASDKKEFEDAANLLVGLFKEKPRPEVNPGERRKQASRILQSAIGTLKRGVDTKEFMNDKDAAKALAWLHPILDLEDAGSKEYFAANIDIAFAALKTDFSESDSLLKTVAERIDKMPAADKLMGYRELGKVYNLDLEQAESMLTKKEAVQRSKRAQDFAYAWMKVDAMEPAADLNGKAVGIEARAIFEQSKPADKATAKYGVFASALPRARAAAQSKDFFDLPVLVAKLESYGSFVRKDLESTIDEGETAVKSPVPNEPWGQVWHAKAMARTADARFELLAKKNDAKEPVDAKSEYLKILGLCKGARDGKYKDRYDGELSVRMGIANYFLGNFKTAKGDLLKAEKDLKSIRKPYEPEFEADINQAIANVAFLLSSKELKNVE